MNRDNFENLRIIFAPIINKYIFNFELPGTGIDKDDLRQEAETALWKSMAKFDPERSNIRSYAKGVVIRHINYIAGAAKLPKRFRGAPVQLDKLQIASAMEVDEVVFVDLSVPDFDTKKIVRRNTPKNAVENTKREPMGNHIHVSDKADDLEFIQNVIASRKLGKEPIPNYWDEPDYWIEDEKYKRVIERYPWGCVAFMSNKPDDEFATVVYVEYEPNPFSDTMIESKALDWYSDLIEHFQKVIPQRPECFGEYTNDPVCDGGYNSRNKLMEAQCLWCGECRASRELPERRTLEQLANNICEAIADVSGVEITPDGDKGTLFITPIKSKADNGIYLNIRRQNGSRYGIMSIKHKSRNLTIGMACEEDQHEVLEKVNWGHYKSAIKKLQTEAQFQAVIEVAVKIIQEMD